MSGIVWLASYPKSGNTWVRLFLARLLHPEGPMSLELVRTIPESADREWVRANGGTLLGVRPWAFRQYAETAAHPILKIHDRCYQPLVPPDVTRAAIYLRRNPYDVARSFAAHSGVERVVAEAFLSNRRATIGGGDGPQGRQQLGTWCSHVESWKRAPFEVLTVRYEDLHADPFHWFRQIADVALPGTTDAAIAAAVEDVRFENLQALETAHGFEEAVHGRFFRVGCPSEGAPLR